MDTPYDAGAGLLASASYDYVSNRIDRFRAWRANRRTISTITRELGAYSDGQLAELGLSRADIADVARGRFRRG